MKKPEGADLMRTLVTLLAEQEGTVITYEIIGDKKDEEENT